MMKRLIVSLFAYLGFVPKNDTPFLISEIDSEKDSVPECLGLDKTQTRKLKEIAIDTYQSNPTITSTIICSYFPHSTSGPNISTKLSKLKSSKYFVAISESTKPAPTSCDS